MLKKFIYVGVKLSPEEHAKLKKIAVAEKRFLAPQATVMLLELLNKKKTPSKEQRLMEAPHGYTEATPPAPEQNTEEEAKARVEHAKKIVKAAKRKAKETGKPINLSWCRPVGAANLDGGKPSWMQT